MRIIACRRDIDYKFFVENRTEAGVVLNASDVPSIRKNGCQIKESYVCILQNEAFIRNMYIEQTRGDTSFSNQDMRKLLLKGKQIMFFSGKIKEVGYSLVPSKVYLNKKNLVKLEICLVKGKKIYDKRKSEKEKEWKRRKSYLLKKNFS